MSLDLADLNAASADSIRRRVAALLEAMPGPLVLGCSYGPDSLVLADAVLAVRARDATLVYVDHGLRPEAAIEAGAVVAFAGQRAAAARVARVEVRPRGNGLEDAARRVRYRALEQIADELEARWILLGHTASDQVETVLGRFLRGAGPFGLAGMRPRRGRIVRPLLEVDRSAIERYVNAHGLVPARDSMNVDPAFTRVRLRHELLPLLRKENPNIDESLLRLARVMGEVSEVIDRAVAEAEAKLGTAPQLAAAELCRLPAAVGKQLLARRAFEFDVVLESGQLDQLWALARRPDAGSLELHLRGLVVRREYGDLILSRPSAPDAPRIATIVDGEPPDGPYLVRTWQPGDRMRPHRLRGHSRKLQDLFTDEKIPVSARRRAVVVVRTRDGEIVWVEHLGPAVSARLQVTLTDPDPAVIYDERLLVHDLPLDGHNRHEEFGE